MCSVQWSGLRWNTRECKLKSIPLSLSSQEEQRELADAALEIGNSDAGFYVPSYTPHVSCKTV